MAILRASGESSQIGDYARDRVSSSAGGTTSVHEPPASASAAPTRRRRMTTSFARPSPTRRASRCVPPEPGIIPRPTSGRPSCDVVGGDPKVARERELEPDAEAVAAMLRDHRLREALGGGDVEARAGTSVSGEAARNEATSPPAVNFPPAPVITTTRTASSPASSTKRSRELPPGRERHAVQLPGARRA